MRFCSATLLLALTLSSHAADWPRFRGPNGSGVSPASNTPASFTPKDVNWSIELPGSGHSSPVVVANKIFITTADPDATKRRLLCIDIDSGRTIWMREFNIRPIAMNKMNSSAATTPVADAQRIYFTFIGDEGYQVFCVDHSGKDLWNYNVGKWVSQHGCGCSPILVDGLLIVPNDQDGPTASIVALDAATGQKKWEVGRKVGKNGAATSTPCVLSSPAGGSQIVLTSREEGITGLDPKSGKTLWAVEKALAFRPVGSPIVINNLVVGTCGEGAGNRACAVIDVSGENTAKLLYKLPTGADYPYVPSPVVKNDLLFTWSDVGTVTCSKLTTGEKVWQEKLKSEKGRIEFFTSPIIAGDKLYNISKEGEMVCLQAADKFEELGRSDLGDKTYATPAIVGDKLIIRTMSKLMSVGK